MAHGDAVIDGNGREFLGHTARRLNLTRDHLTKVFQVHVAGHELGERVDNCDDRLAEITVLHAGGAPQSSGTCIVAAMGGRAGTIDGHGYPPGFVRHQVALAVLWVKVRVQKISAECLNHGLPQLDKHPRLVAGLCPGGAEEHGIRQPTMRACRGLDNRAGAALEAVIGHQLHAAGVGDH